MNDRYISDCKDDYPFKIPDLIGINAAGYIEITGSTFLLSPQGCCAQTVLPFWAKVIGRIKNCAEEEIYLKINVHLFDTNNKILSSHADIMILEGGQRGEFDVKLTGYDKNISKYSIEVEETASF